MQSTKLKAARYARAFLGRIVWSMLISFSAKANDAGRRAKE
jgi:hypothetical protein